MNDLDFYSQKSSFTDLGIHSADISQLKSPSIPAIAQIVQGLLIHEADGALFGVIHVPRRLKEKNLRFAIKILNRAKELDKRSLLKPREPSKRVIATCRDFATMFVAMCRLFNIPARVRAGFVSYLYNGEFCGDHRLVEYWDSKRLKWVMIDCRLTELHQAKLHLDFNLMHLPDGKFINAGNAWLSCLAQKEKAKLYGYGLNRKLNGMWYIRDILMHDLANLNKYEMIPWDAWGYMYYSELGKDPVGEEQMQSLLELAHLIHDNAFDYVKLNRFFNNPSLKVPSIIISYDKLFGPASVEVT